MITAKGKTSSRELVKKFFTGSYPADIEKRFHLWLINEAKWEEKEEALKDMWETISHGDPKEVIGSLHDVKKKLGLPQKSVKLGRSRFALKVAAVVVPVLLLAGTWVLVDRMGDIRQERLASATLEASAGQSVTLPDNTVVEITEGMLFYPSRFSGTERRVRLEGSAYFEVADDTDTPFVIENDMLTVRMTGTQFLLATDSENGKFSFALVEGSVDVMILGKAPIALSEGKELKYDVVADEVAIEPLPDHLSGKEALTQGRLVFENATVGEILQAAARSRGYELHMGSLKSGSKTYNVKFINDENIEDILGVLNVLTNSSFTYIIENSNIYIE